jgi:hypothetical protein
MILLGLIGILGIMPGSVRKADHKLNNVNIDIPIITTCINKCDIE